MLSLQRCRAILGHRLDDADLERVRDQLYAVAAVTVEAFIQGQRSPAPRDVGSLGGEADRRDALALLPPEERVAVEERAALMEFDGGLDRDRAERHAVLRLVRRDGLKETRS